VSEETAGPKASEQPSEMIVLTSGLAKLWQGLRRTWKLYRHSKMGLLGLGIVVAFLAMAVFAPFLSPYSPDFRAPSSDIFIADYANLDLGGKRNWTTPIGITTVLIGEALKKVMVYSTEGDTKVYPVKPGRSEITGGSGINVEDPDSYTLPKNLSYVSYVKFPTPFPSGGDPEIAGSFFFLLEGTWLHQYEANLVNSTVQWKLPFVPRYHSNLWNGYSLTSSNSRLALAFANDTMVWLIVMRPSIPQFETGIKVYISNLTIPGAKIVSSPIVMDTNVVGGSVLAVPTDVGLHVYRLNVTRPGGLYVSNVTIGDLLWKTDYRLPSGELVEPIATDTAITFPNPTNAGGLFGKMEILLAVEDGRVVSYNTFNGTVNWANRLVMAGVRDYSLSALYPSPAGVIVVGKAGSSRGFIAGVDPQLGVVMYNQTAYSSTEGFINSQPAFVEGPRNFIYSTDKGIVYLADEILKVNATFAVPSGGMVTPVSYLGNIYVAASSTTGSYFGTVTADGSLYVETLSGVNVAPLPPGTYPSGNRYILGTDYEGHDILSWLIYGTRSELLVGVVAALFAVVIGTVVGLVAGFYSGLVDDLLMRATDVVLSLPFIVIALLFASVFGPLLVNIIIIIAVLSWAGIARVIRSVTLSLKERAFVDAAIIAGASESRLIFRHIAPNVLPYTFLYMTFTVSGAIITEAILAFLGFGDPSNVTWGMMLQFLQISGHSLDAPWWLLPPGIAITLLSLSFYLIGRAFDEVVNPRLRRR